MIGFVIQFSEIIEKLWEDCYHSVTKLRQKRISYIYVCVHRAPCSAPCTIHRAPFSLAVLHCQFVIVNAIRLPTYLHCVTETVPVSTTRTVAMMNAIESIARPYKC